MTLRKNPIQHKKNLPLISIITVTYNAEEYLQGCIDSIRDITYKNIEYIVIDGKSTDKTTDIILKNQDVISYWESKKDNGIYYALNKAISHCNGCYYLVLGSDDRLYSNSIDDLVRHDDFETEMDFLCCSIQIGSKIRSGVRDGLHTLGAGNMIPGHSVGMLINPSFHDKVGLYDLRYSVSADAAFIKKAFKHSQRWKGIDIVMGSFSTDGVSNSSTLRALTENFMIQMETEKIKLLQICLFLARIIKNYRRL